TPGVARQRQPLAGGGAGRFTASGEAVWRTPAGLGAGNQRPDRPAATHRQLARLCQPPATGVAGGSAMSPPPHLCVVGHPNRGKSSLVATLTENDAVRIGPESGTTTRADHFDFVLQGRVLLR